MTGWSLFIVLTVVMSLLVFLWSYVRGWAEEWGDIWWTFIAALIGTFLAAIAYGVIGMVTGEQVKEDERELIALSTGSEVSGRFFLGSGSIDQKPVYTYMRPTGDGGAKMETVAASQTTVYEIDDESQPRIEMWHKQSEIAPDITYGGPAWNGGGKNFKVFIPEGSIWQGYSVDVRDGS